ncbi:MAG: HEAT repeat domain-containing protein, partial [Acidobacteria bacterium]|nr:HEAT repeat domain-containing protein [Acidobacteriota bacterium]
MRSSGIPQTTWLCCSLILVCALVWHPFPRPLRAEQKAIQTRQVPVDSLIFDLKNPDPVRRRDAARLLGENKIQRAIPDLVATAGDADATVRRAVITALAAMEDIGALPAFVNRMGDSEKDIRQKCIQVVVGLHLPKESGFMASVNRVATFFNPWSDEWAETVVEPGIRVDPSVIEALRKRLDDPDEGLRVESCRALGILRGREVAPDMAAL